MKLHDALVPRVARLEKRFPSDIIPAAFTPPALGGCNLWLPMRRYPIGSLATAKDFSGAGNDLAAVSAASVSAVGPNGTNALDLTAATHSYNKATALTGTSGFTMVAVFAAPAINGAVQCLFSVGNGNGWIAPTVNSNTNRAILPTTHGNTNADYPSGALSFATSSGRCSPTWEIWVVRCAPSGATQTWSMRVNGVNKTLANNPVAMTSPSALTTLGNDGGGFGFGFRGYLAELALFSFVLSDDDVAIVEAYLAKKHYLDRPSVIWDGNSIAYGADGTTAQAPPAIMASTLGLLDTQWFNNGISGQDTPTMASNTARVSGSISSALRPRAPLVIGCEVSNDLKNGTSAATAIANYQTWVTNVLAWGGLPVAQTALDRGDVDITDRLPTVNAAIKANWQSWGCVALDDWAADPVMGPIGAWRNTTYFSGSDMVHPTPAGSALLGARSAANLSGFF